MLLQIILPFVGIEKITLCWSFYHVSPASTICLFYFHSSLSQSFLFYLHLGCMCFASFHLSHISDGHPVLQWWLTRFWTMGRSMDDASPKVRNPRCLICFYPLSLLLPFLVTSFCILVSLSDGNENSYLFMESTLRLGMGSWGNYFTSANNLFFVLDYNFLIQLFIVSQ